MKRYRKAVKAIVIIWGYNFVSAITISDLEPNVRLVSIFATSAIAVVLAYLYGYENRD